MFDKPDGRYEMQSEVVAISVPSFGEVGVTLWRPIAQRKCAAVLIVTPYEERWLTSSVLQVGELCSRGFAVLIVRSITFLTAFEDEVLFNWARDAEVGQAAYKYLGSCSWWNGSIYIHGASFSGSSALAILESRAIEVRGASLAMFSAAGRKVSGGLVQLDAVAGFYARAALAHSAKLMLTTEQREYFSCACRNPVEFAREIARGVLRGDLNIVGIDMESYLLGEKDIYPQIEWAKVHCRVLFTTGFYDMYFQDVLEAHTAMSKASPDLAALIVGPWQHSSTLSPIVRGKNFGLDGSGAAFGLSRRIAEMFSASEDGVSICPDFSIFDLMEEKWLSHMGRWMPITKEAVPVRAVSDIAGGIQLGGRLSELGGLVAGPLTDVEYRSLCSASHLVGKAQLSRDDKGMVSVTLEYSEELRGRQLWLAAERNGVCAFAPGVIVGTGRNGECWLGMLPFDVGTCDSIQILVLGPCFPEFADLTDHLPV